MESQRHSQKQRRVGNKQHQPETNKHSPSPETYDDLSSDHSSQQILQLQRTIGNQATLRFLDNSDTLSQSGDMVQHTPDSVLSNFMPPMIQRTPSNVIQRNGGDKLPELKSSALDLTKERHTLQTQIEQITHKLETVTNRKERSKLKRELSKLKRKDSRLQYKLKKLHKKLKPLMEVAPKDNPKAAVPTVEEQLQGETDQQYKTYAEVEALTLTQLKEYVESTPGWLMRSTHTKEQKATMMDIQTLAVEDGTLAVLGGFTVASIVSETGTLSDKLDNLREFIKAVRKEDPFSLSVAPDLATANKRGEALKKLKTGFPDYVLTAAMNEFWFIKLVDDNYIDDVVKYYTTASQKPIFQAEDGWDFRSYYLMRKQDTKDPLDYDGTVLNGKIRNYHRFQAAALNQLVLNYGEKGVRPLTIILHSAIDHNGAFHRDPKMTDVITNANINAIMIEGGETLAEYKSQIGPLAKEYGIYGKIDQVMFAGHGGSRVIEMAGTVKQGKDGKLKQVDNAIDLAHDKKAADELFEEVLKNMDQKYEDDFIGPQLPKQQNRRILFNACLTNSNAVERAVNYNEPAKAKQAIKKYLQDNASLATYFQEMAKKNGQDVKSMGANASITQFDMIKPSGELDMVSTEDPKIAASKLEYAEHGHEPLGTLRAALESWASNDVAALAAMQRRAGLGSTSWDDVIIESMYDTIIKKQGSYDISALFKAYTNVAHDVSALKLESHAKVSDTFSIVRSLPDELVNPIFGKLTGADEWSTKHYIPLVVMQLWMHHYAGDANLHKGLLNQLRYHFNAKTGKKFIDIGYLTGKTLMAPILTSGGNAKGKRILSLIGLLDSDEAESKKYLQSIRTPDAPAIAGLPAVPAVPEVPEQDAPRDRVPSVPAVPGRAEVKEIKDKRPAVAAIPELPELPELAAVKAKKGETVKAPGRPGRPKRDAVAEVPKVDEHFAKKWKIKALLAGTATEDEILKKIK